MRILLVRLSALGDVVTGLHPLSSLRTRYPEGRIGWLVEDRFAALLEGHPQLDRLHVYERGKYRRGRLWALVRLLRGLRRERYDVALDLQGNLKSGVLTRLSGARRTLGLAPPLSREGNRLFLRELVTPPEGHRVDAYRRLVDAAFGPGPHAPPVLPASGGAPGAVVLHPGTSRFGAFKQWPLPHFAELGRRLAARLGAPVVVTAGPGEGSQAAEVARAIEGARVAEPAGLRALADLLGGARLVVACDTGPAHIAATLGVPTLTLFGPKDPRHAAPVGPRARAVRKGVRCSPCALRYCPDPVCMTTLGVDEVEREALRLLEGAK